MPPKIWDILQGFVTNGIYAFISDRLVLSLFHDDLLAILDIESAMQVVCLCTLQGVSSLVVLVLSGNGVDTGFPMR